MSGGKVNRNWLDLDPESPDGITAGDIAYDSTASIKTKIIELGSREIEYFTLDATDITNKYITLDGASLNEEIDMVVVGGPTQQYQVDFILLGDRRISWSSAAALVGMDSDLIEGDILQITYAKLEDM